ncbi:MAG: sodium:proline symporter [Pirellulaceae bacterium]|nr:MAG: sodium:proline symporter [Pirellulaceae bacterium]
MELTWLDQVIIGAYFVLMVVVGILWKGRAGRSAADFFVSGRSMPWWLAGTSMVATTFAADTPLAVTGLVVRHGLAGNWFWWSMAVGGMLTVFVFSHLWRRAEVMTDVELIELRYGGKPAAALRAFRAVYLVLIINPIVMGWVTGAMLKVIHYGLLGSDQGVASRQTWADLYIIALLLASVGLYSVAAGLWGVAITDLVQFVLAMGGCVALAVLAVRHVGGLRELERQIVEQFGSDEPLRLLPDFASTDPWMPLGSFAIMLGVLWWASWYPGAEPGGGGFIVQRMAACRDERHARLATLWFQLAHYCLRPWPWLLVALAALLIIPDLHEAQDPDAGYVLVMRRLAPSGLRGLLLVTFFAAYMSTISTQVNWGASYLVRDLYERFWYPNASQRQLVRASRWASLLVLCLGALASWWMRHLSVDTAWKFLAALGAGTGAVFMARWFWWRINAWAEIAAMIASLIIFGAIQWATRACPWREEYVLAVNAVLTCVVWLAVMWLTPPEAPEVLVRFFRKVRPPGWGWAHVRRLAPDVETDRDLGRSVAAAASGLGLLYGTLFAIGGVLLAKHAVALVSAIVALLGAAGVWVCTSIGKTGSPK